MFSPTFECSLDGLRSAVRLRAVVQGHADPDARVSAYFAARAWRMNPAPTSDELRQWIQVVIEDIEELTSTTPVG